jgi:hypothetical protein
MNIAELQNKLLRVARYHAPADHVPYAFEQRIMNTVRLLPSVERWEFRALVLWRAALVCVLLTACVGAWDFASDRRNTFHEILGADLENTVLAAVEHPGEPW